MSWEVPWVRAGMGSAGKGRRVWLVKNFKVRGGKAKFPANFEVDLWICFFFFRVAVDVTLSFQMVGFGMSLSMIRICMYNSHKRILDIICVVAS